MAATIQHIELPKKPRALDTSTSTHVISEELIVNGDFASDTAWGKSSATYSTITGGKGVLDGLSAGQNASLFQQVLTQGRRYRLVFDVTFNQDPIDTTDSRVIDISGNTIYAITGNATGITVEFTHKSVHPHILFQAKTGSKYSIDNVSILEIENFSNSNHGQIYSGRALEFDGVTDYFQSNGGQALNGINQFNNGVPWTFACWMYFENAASFFVGHDGVTNQKLITAANGHIWFRDAANGYFEFSTKALNLNTWYRVVVTTDGTSMTSYLNGVINGTIADGQARVPSTGSGSAFNDTQMEFSGWGIPYEDGGVRGNAFKGRMSDSQVWDKAWSVTDVAYDFANPESLALNASGTALTEGNLKLWYPMQDGHRGQQSYILDGANTGLGDEIVVNGDFSNGTTGWTSPSQDGFVFNVVDSKLVVHTGTPPGAGGTNFLTQFNAVGTLGVTYKLTVDASDFIGDTKVYFRLDGNQKPGSPATDILRVEDGSNTIIFTAYEDFTFLKIVGTSHSKGVTLDNISLKAINDKHHATTVFHGDEQIAILKNRTGFADSEWAAHNIASGNVTVVNGALQVVTETDAAPEGVKLAASNFVNDLVAGRTYRVSVDLKQTSGATTPAMKIELGNAQSPPFNISASSVTYTKDIIAVDDDELIIFSNSSSSATTFIMDNVSIQEVGVASGWADADQQLDIAQTALQSYNEMAWFDGFNDRLAVTEFSFEVGQSINMWVFINDTSASRDFFGKQGGTFDFVRTKNNSSTHEIQFETHLDNNTVVASLGDAGVIREGEWVMWTFIWISSDRKFKVYMNGVHTGTSTATNNSVDGKLLKVNSFGNAQANIVNMQGAITEISYYNDQLAQNEINDLYNDGKAKSALEASGFAGLVHYWRNNGLSTWTDLKGTNNGAPTSVTETLLCPQGVDGTRCSQGYIMNKPRTTSSLNFTTKLQSGYVDVGPLAVDFGTGDFSAECWVQYGFINDSTFGVTGSGLNVVFSNGLASSDDTEGINLLSTASDFKFRIGDGDKENSKNINPSPLTVGKWYHIVVTREGTAVVIYLDGAEHNTGTIPSGIDIGNEPFKIGNDRVAADRQYKKPIDGFKLYSKVLDLAEVKRNYKATKGSHRN